MARHKDSDWNVGGDDKLGLNPTMDGAQLAVLMDLRDELKEIRACLWVLKNIFNCDNFRRIPAKIDAIRKNTDRKKRAAKTK